MQLIFDIVGEFIACVIGGLMRRLLRLFTALFVMLVRRCDWETAMQDIDTPEEPTALTWKHPATIFVSVAFLIGLIWYTVVTFR